MVIIVLASTHGGKGKNSCRQRLISASRKEEGACLHSSDVYRRVQRAQARPAMFELVVINSLRAIALALRVHPSKKFNRVVYEMDDLASVLVHNGA